MLEIVERREARPLGVFEWSTLAILCVACIATIAVLGTKLTFFNDDWYFLLQRPGLESGGGIDVLLAPHNSNGVVLTALAYKALVAMFGFGPQLPFRLLVGIIVAAAGVLVFAFVRARSGRLIALAAAAVVMFMGAAWEDLLFFAAGIDQVGAVATGLGALLVLERHDRSGGAMACILLVCSIGFSNVGAPFVLAAAVALWLRGEFSRLWVAAVPGVLFAFWWAFYGVKQPSHITIANVEHLPRYVFDSLSIGLASLTGLNGGAAALARGHVLSLITLAAVIVWLLRGGRPRWQLAVPVCAAATFWVLTGASFIPGREPIASRYQLVDVTLLILIIAELLWSVRWTPLRTGIVAVLACSVVVSNITIGLVHGYRFLRAQSQYVRADLGALQIARPIDPADVWLLDPIAHNPYVSGITSRRYFAEAAAHGQPPGDSVRELRAAPAPIRQSADGVLSAAERIAPSKTVARVHPGACTRLALSGELPLAPGRWLLREVGTGVLVIAARRFAPPDLSVNVGFIAPSITERLTVPSDGVAERWRLRVFRLRQAAAALELCHAANAR